MTVTTDNTMDIVASVGSGSKSPRWQVMLTFRAALIVGAFAVPSSFAQDFPVRPVRLITPFQAGSLTDIQARTIAQGLTAKWKQPVVVDNRPGAGGIAGVVSVVTAPPDGYTLLIGSSGTHAIVPALYEKLQYDAIKDFTPVTQVGTAYSMLVVHPSVPAKSVAELIALAKSKPGLTFGSGGVGTTPHIAGELFKSMTGVQMTHVPYKGSPLSVLDLVEGRIHMIFANVTSVQQHIKSGRLRVLGVSTPQRVRDFPDVPTIAESGLPGYATEIWQGIFVPARTPSRLVEQIGRDVRCVLENEEVVRMWATQATFVKTSTPQVFAKFVREEMVKWGKVVKDSGAKPE